MYLVFHPKMMDLIDPRIIRFKSKLDREISHLIFANSITLTPGTITVFVSIYGDYAVHAIDQQSGQSLPGEMEKRVSKILGE
jgi:multicomponent Na+:H+ antiporter subunit E